MNLGEGERIVAPAGDPRSGESLQITVRPEKIKLGAGAGGERGQARRAGTVAEVVYLGSMTQVIVELRTGERLVVHRLNDEVDGDPRSAGDVVLHWAAEHSFVIGGRASVAAGAG